MFTQIGEKKKSVKSYLLYYMLEYESFILYVRNMLEYLKLRNICSINSIGIYSDLEHFELVET